MSAGVIGASAIGEVDQPSPSIWGDCPNTLLPDKGLGYFVHQDFLGDYSTPAATTTAPGIGTVTGTGTSVFGNAASATYGANVLSMATGATDNNNTGVVGEELGTIVRNSGKKLWFEARVALAALGDAALFVGLSTRAGANTATTGVLGNDPSNSAVATTQAVTTIGFLSVQAASAIATLNARYTKTTGTAVTVATNVTQSVAIPVADRANVVAATFVKLGIRFDGGKYLYFYVNGYRVGKQEVDSTIDQTALYTPVIAAKAGAAVAVTTLIDFVRYGYQKRS
jgi:hypothetical protein